MPHWENEVKPNEPLRESAHWQPTAPDISRDTPPANIPRPARTLRARIAATIKKVFNRGA